MFRPTVEAGVENLLDVSLVSANLRHPLSSNTTMKMLQSIHFNVTIAIIIIHILEMLIYCLCSPFDKKKVWEVGRYSYVVGTFLPSKS